MDTGYFQPSIHASRPVFAWWGGAISNGPVCMCERGAWGREGVYANPLSDTLQPNGRAEAGTRPGGWSRNTPMDLSACVS
jgi:hypothetical protein